MIENRKPAEVAAIVIADLLRLIPPEKRLAALAIATKAEEEEVRQASKGPIVHNACDLANDKSWNRYWNAEMRFKARLICSFVRDITNNHSKEAAGQLLFHHQPNVPGSGYLHEYLDGLITTDKPRFQSPAKARSSHQGERS